MCRGPHGPTAALRLRVVQEAPKWTPLNEGLNESQRAAVTFALCAGDVALVHGPPGALALGSVRTIAPPLTRGMR